MMYFPEDRINAMVQRAKHKLLVPDYPRMRTQMPRGMVEQGANSSVLRLPMSQAGNVGIGLSGANPHGQGPSMQKRREELINQLTDSDERALELRTFFGR